MKSFVFPFALCFFCVPGAWLFGQSGENVDSLGFRELILRMAVEREKLVQFAVDCTVTGVLHSPFLPSNVDGTAANRSQYRFEYSRVENHSVVAYRSELSSGNTEFRVMGVSGKCKFYTDNDTLLVKDRDDLPVTYGIGKELPQFFDPRATGLGACGDLAKSSSFEKICSNLMNWKLNDRVQNKEGIFEYKSVVRGIELLVDSKQGYWPKKFVFAPPSSKSSTEWSSELEKTLGYYVPRKSTLKCNSGDAKTTTTEFIFDWESINEPFSTGFEAVERFAHIYDFKIEDKRQKE